MPKRPGRVSLCLIDGSSYFYRAFFAIRPLTNSKGLHVNAIYGFTQMILKVIHDLKPDYVAVVFDSKEPTFRHEMYKEYKANRDEMPTDLQEQIPYIKKVVNAFNIHSLEKSGFEADDLIATVCEKFKQKDIDIQIVSSDKDLMQLISDHVTMIDTMKDRTIKILEVKEKFGVRPDQVIEVLALMGDSSDNVPGVPGVGPKTASTLIQTYGSLENVYQHTGELKGKLKERIEENKEKAFLSRQLVTLDRKSPIQFELDQFEKEGADEKEVRALFSELEFESLLGRLGFTQKKSEQKRKSYTTVSTEKEFGNLVLDLKKSPHFSVDLETTSLDTRKAAIVGISLAHRKGEELLAFYTPVGHTSGKQLDRSFVLETLKPLLEDPKIGKVGQHIKYDALILAYHGIWVTPLSDDSMIASYILDPAGPHNMDHLAKKFLDYDTIKYDDVTKRGNKRVLFDEVPIDEATAYSGEDADVTYQLVDLLRGELKKEKRLTLYETLEMPLVSILLKMEYQGVKINIPFLKKLSQEYESRMTHIEKEIYHLAGETFNIQSPKQLSQILFEKLKLSPVKKTRTRGPSTNSDVLTQLSEHHDLPKQILAFRELAKLKSTYVDALIDLADPKTERVHTSYNQTIAATGRLSSSDPNLQNIPIRTEEGQKIRAAFIAEEGHLLLSADYSQVELRLLAHLSKDPALVAAFHSGKDIHTETAAEVLGVSQDLVTPEMRRMAKAINFGLIYGLSAFGLSKQLGISNTQARQYIDRYFTRYKEVKAFIEQTIKTAHETGFVETMMGRRRYLPDLKSSNPMVRQMTERMAVNTPIQGSAADLIKKAMIEIDRKLTGLSSKMILQVHDELVFEVPQAELKTMTSLVKEEMEGGLELIVPIVVDIHSGNTWAEAH